MIYSGLKEPEEKQRLSAWRERYEAAKSRYSDELARIREYNEYLQGTKKMIKYGREGKKPKDALLSRNICYELIEAQIDNNIPMPKVTATREEEVGLAVKIENKMRNEIERLPFLTMLDLQERETPTDGGSFFLIEWDNTQKTHNTVGNLSVRVLSASQVIPQPGVYEIKDMDYIFVRLSQTKKFIKDNYGVSVCGEGEEETEYKSLSPDENSELITQVICYYKNSKSGIGKFSFAGDTVLEDIEDYQARILKRCVKCGKIVTDDECECGSKSFEFKEEEFEELEYDITETVTDETGREETVIKIPKGTKIPYFKPDIYPVILRRNVSKFGSFLGSSDIELIKYQQDIINKCETDCLEKMLKGGSIVTLPNGLKVQNSDENFKIVKIDNASQIDMIKAINIQPDTGRTENYAEMQYQRARQILGITDSFQGRKDSSANSGTAKQAAIQQTAGRLESKRIMKNSCFSELYKAMTMFLIAFADEPRTLVVETKNGDSVYDTFSKYDFLKKDIEGSYYYSFDYLFSTDNTGTLASNREALWQENAQNLARGAFGVPNETDTLIVFWQSMLSAHYPNAGRILASLKDRMTLEKQYNMLLQENEQLKGENARLGEGIDQLGQRNTELYDEAENYRRSFEDISGYGNEGGAGGNAYGNESGAGENAYGNVPGAD